MGRGADGSESAVPAARTADLMSQLVERAETSAHLQRRLTTLLDANRSIVSELTLAGVLRRIVEAARAVAGARYAALGVLGSAGQLAQFVHVGMDAATVATIGELPTGRGVLGALIKQPQPIRLHAIAADARSSGFPPGHPPMSTFLGVPVQTRGVVFGNLYLTDRLDGDDFTAEDEELVVALAATASIAIENARLYEDARHRQEWLRASAELSRDLLRTDTVSDDEMLQRVATTVERLADADIVTVVLPYDAQSFLVTVATGRDSAPLHGFVYPRQESLVQAAMTNRQAQTFDAYAADAPYYVHQQAIVDVGPVMACPLISESSVRGAIVVGRRQGRQPFEEADLEMAESFATYAAVTLELADSRAGQQRLEMLEDRHRIARDLHDHVVQQLFAAGLKISRIAARSADPEQRHELDQTLIGIDDTIDQIRETIFELKDRHSVTGTVRAAILAVVDDLEPALGRRPEVTFSGPVGSTVDDDLLHDVTAVTREALTNVHKHTHADAVRLGVGVDDGVLTIVVRDNGSRPFQENQTVVSGHGNGLANLSERARARGGTMTLEHDDGGTTLRWTARLTKTSGSTPPKEQRR